MPLSSSRSPVAARASGPRLGSGVGEILSAGRESLRNEKRLTVGSVELNPVRVQENEPDEVVA